MKIIIKFILVAALILSAETLFEVKDASNNKVLDVSTDGLRIMNMGDTVMVISSNEIKANISSSKGLSRSFCISTASSKGSGIDLMKLTSDSTRFWISDTGTGFGVASQTAPHGKSIGTNFLKVSNVNTVMREGTAGDIYTNFSPDNIFLGLQAGIESTPGTPFPEAGKNNVFIGNNSGYDNGSGYDNVFIGDSSGVSNTSGFRNINIGRVAGKNNTYGSDNIYIGYKAGSDGTSTSQNIAIGNYAGRMNESSQNMFIGEFSGELNYNGDRNSFVGFFSGQNNISGSNNSYFGQMAGMDNTMSNNTMIGYWAGGKNIDGQNNTFLGYRSGVQSTGSDNLFLGYQAGELNYGSDNVMIGYQAGKQSLNLSNSLYIANSSTTTPLIKGTFPNTNLTFNAETVYATGKLGVGIGSPVYSLHSIDETSGNDNPAVYGKHNVTDNFGVGVTGEGGYRGVIGNGTATSGYVTGVRGVSNGTGTGMRYGVYGNGSGGENNYGLYGYSSGTGTVNYGVYGSASGATTNYAGYFSGNVYVTGTVTANDYIEFKSDHPKDPENKYLSHSSVSSSEMLNVYSGNVVLDKKGNGSVQMPEWFEAYNFEFRYQLTAIGSSAPGLHISKELENGNFHISGGNAGMKVSWMVTAVRNDNYAKTYPIKVVTEKNGSEKGYYLAPEVFGRSKDRSIESLYNKNDIEKRGK
ncbi:MAG TPA: hypothetical protein PLK90_05850 [Clostridiales bacterium]|nr:hypothetical protein [Clostridiales bacterium]HQP69907.1 hypothetical protein [Clostridiales bacterium]